MGAYPSAALALRPPEQPNLIRNISDLLGLKQQLQQYQSGELENQTRALQVQQLQRTRLTLNRCNKRSQRIRGQPTAICFQLCVARFSRKHGRN
jgi:hypothetical protein